MWVIKWIVHLCVLGPFEYFQTLISLHIRSPDDFLREILQSILMLFHGNNIRAGLIIMLRISESFNRRKYSEYIVFQIIYTQFQITLNSFVFNTFILNVPIILSNLISTSLKMKCIYCCLHKYLPLLIQFHLSDASTNEYV